VEEKEVAKIAGLVGGVLHLELDDVGLSGLLLEHQGGVVG